ncbi:MAG: lipocalin family protein [Rikenellaceae bacterium]
MKLAAIATLITSTALAITAAKVSSATAATTNRTTVAQFDITKYLGKWHEIARFDNKFERNLINVTATYTMLPDGKIEVQNRGYNTKEQQWSCATGKAKRTATPGKLKVSFFWFFYAQYNILALGKPTDPTEQYPWALVGSKSNKYLWILSRTDTLDTNTTRKIIAIAQARGYDTSKLTFRKQAPNTPQQKECCTTKVVSTNQTHNKIANNIAVRFITENIAYAFDMLHYAIIQSEPYKIATSGKLSDEIEAIIYNKKSVANRS